MRQKITNITKEASGVIENVASFAVIGGLVVISVQKGLLTLTPDQVTAVGCVGLAFMVFRFLLTRR